MLVVPVFEVAHTEALGSCPAAYRHDNRASWRALGLEATK